MTSEPSIDFASPSEPTTALAIMATSDPNTDISDPYTRAGQQVGAVLRIKRRTEDVEVGDLFQIVEHKAHVCRAKSNRTGNTLAIPWVSFLPLKLGETCICSDGRCRCERDPGDVGAYLVSVHCQLFCLG